MRYTELMTKAIIFDFFDVIRDDGFNRWLRKHGSTKTGEFLEASNKNDRGEYTPEQFFRRLGELSGETADEVEDEMENNNQLNEQLVGYIQTELKPKYKVGLLSNSDSEYIRGEIDKYQLESVFDRIVISSEVGHIKPEPEIFEIALSRLGVGANEAIFVDDNPNYVAAAEAVGLQGVIYRDFDEFKQQLAHTRNQDAVEIPE